MDASFETMDEARAHIKEQTHPNNTRISAGSHRCTHSALHSFGPKVVERWTIIMKKGGRQAQPGAFWFRYGTNSRRMGSRYIKVSHHLRCLEILRCLENLGATEKGARCAPVQPVPILPGDDMG